MKYFATLSFWDCYRKLPTDTQEFADENFKLLRQDSRHPSLHLKKVGTYWSARVGMKYRTLAVEVEEGLLWFWIGSHARRNQNEFTRCY